MKKVLWVSRHQMTESQMADLERVMGGPVELLLWWDNVKSVDQLVPMIAQADALAVVLPPQLLSDLMPLAGDRPVLQAINRRVPTGNVRTLPDGRTEQEFQFVHGGWQQILHMELKTKML